VELSAEIGRAIPYIATFLIGASVGAIELIGRYRDEPFQASRSRPALFYMTVNGLASVFVLAAAQVFGWDFGSSANPDQATLVQVVVAGFAAMAVLRTSLFTVRVADTEIGIGPVALLQVLLVAIDRGVDRDRAANRATATGRIMSGLQFATISEALPTYSIALMQNLTTEDQARLGKQVGELVGSKMDDRLKVLILGLLVMNAVGEEVLAAAVTSIRKEVSPPASQGRRLPSIFGGDKDPVASDSDELDPGAVDVSVVPIEVSAPTEQATSPGPKP
jgi:hypothetical protein